jgi:hypothetical protein
MAAITDVTAVEIPSREDFNNLPLGARAMLDDLEEMRMGNIVSAWRNGDIGNKEAGTLTIRRISQKLGMNGKIVPFIQSGEDKANFKKASFMEGGWEKRGRGSSIKRTIEIYSFGIKIVLRELKLRKVEDKVEKSAVRKLIAQDLREVFFRKSARVTSDDANIAISVLNARHLFEIHEMPDRHAWNAFHRNARSDRC